ncbi:MAG TPA: 7TM diverse intracellular signaling domain-containing protein, partial [Leptospiraceae bacterium]|nr:7TM diverse intracellular signaling domain-containing protein [Leptospiraceae bacterium]
MVAGRIFCAGVFLFLPLFALFPEPISLPEKSGISVGRILEILEDREGKFTIAQAMAEKGWKAGSADILNFGPTSSVYWARFRLKNNTTEESWLVAQRVPLMEDIVFYEILPEIVSSRVGMMFPFGQRKINHRYFLFPVRILPGEEREFVLRFSNSDIMTFDIAVFSAMDFYREAAFEYLIFGLYFGTMLIMVLYNFFIFLSARDPSYRSYIFFTAVAALHAFSQNGFSYQFFWPDHPWFASRINVMLVGIYAATGLSFTRSFLSVSTLRPRFDLYIRAFIIVALFYSAASAFVEFQLAVRLATFISLATLLTMLSAGILSILSGFRSARFFLAGFVAFIAGGTAYSLKTLGILPSNVLTHYGIQAGSIVEVVLFSLALADRINFLRLDLASKIEDLDRAKNRIELSERKYRSLV